ncbi:MAG: hypothetical protein KKA62_05915 [Nanoarchaeota archaeon]|nr:hypothetical protein [Nanoarchaeota archaeon]
MYRLLPSGYRKRLDEWLRYSGSKKHPESFVKTALIISIIVAMGASLILSNYAIYLFPVSFIATFLMMHGFLILAVEKRSAFVESILPDALQLVAANIKSGFIPSRALILSARKEFGPLSDAIKNVGKEVMTGKPLTEAMNEMTKTIKKNNLKQLNNYKIYIQTGMIKTERCLSN